MQIFRDRLDAALAAHAGSPTESRRWLYVAYDQLSDRIGPLAARAPDELGVVLVESLWRPRQRPYHRQKLALILANQRHFALEQATRGVAVRYLASRHDYATVLRGVIDELGSLQMMRPAEYELRELLRPLVDESLLEWLPHDGWLTTAADFAKAGKPGGPWRNDAFYRAVRHRTGILMEDGKPVGGRYSHDGDNRQVWKGEPTPPTPPLFEPDEVTREVVELIESRFARHPGALDPTALPATAADARRLREWAREECLEHFGPYEDYMTVRSKGLFHTRVSPLVNLHRILPREVVEDALAADLPLNSKEGFVRQVIGWREFMRWVHEATDGFRSFGFSVAERPGDAGWTAWSEEGAVSEAAVSEAAVSEAAPVIDGGVDPDTPGGDLPVLPAWWGTESGLNCLDSGVRDVMETGWTHHIPRLMVLSNLATLIGVSPRAITDWFWVAFIDAFDWVTEPNVLAMGTFGVGEVMTTKPYVSGAAYIDRMSDYCSGCAFHPKKSCPITPMYWSYLWRNRERLEGNPRISLPLRNVQKRGEERRAQDERIWRWVRETLETGERLTPEDVPA